METPDFLPAKDSDIRSSAVVSLGKQALHGSTGVVMAGENQAIVQRWLDEFWSLGNLTLADGIILRACLRHHPNGPMIGL